MVHRRLNGAQRTNASRPGRSHAGCECATHPWRIVLGWVGIIAVLVVVVATAGGNLKDEFEIPGSDTQKATDLIESEFAEEQGGVLNLARRAARRAPGHGRAQGRGRGRDRRAQVRAQADRGHGRDRERRRSLRRRHVLRRRPHRLRGSAVHRVIYTKPTAKPSSRRRVRETVAPAGVTVEFNGDAEFPPIEQGQELLGLLAALIVLLIVFRTFVASAILILLALTALATAFILLFILASLTDINTITPLLVSMIGLGVGIDYSLFIVTRFRQLLHEGLSPADAAAEAGASAGRVLFAGLTVAISVTACPSASTS